MPLKPAPRTPTAAALVEARSSLISVTILGAFANIAALATPLYSIQVYDRVLTSRNLTTLVMLTLIAAATIAVYAALDGLRLGVLQRVSVAIDRRLSESAFDAAFRARLSARDADAQRAFRDVATLRDFVATGLAAFLDLPWTPIFVALSFAIHFALGLTAVIGAAAVAAAALGAEMVTRRAAAAATIQQSAAYRRANAALRDAETVSVLGMRPAMRAAWRASHEAMMSRQAASAGYGAVFLSLTKFVRIGVQIAIMGVAAYLVVEGAIQAGVIFAASLMIGRALAPVEQAVASWRRFVAAREAWSALDALFKAAPESAEPLELPRPAGGLSMTGVYAAAPNGAMVLKNVTFAVEPGEALAIVGPSGSGKSSLARVLAGLWSPASGMVRIDGAALGQWSADKLGRHFGYVPQDILLSEGTIAENIARHGAVESGAVIEAARAAGAHETILRLPKGYGTLVGETGETLSGGMRQRVALARALFGNPAIVVLDEPNSNLDADGDKALGEAIAGLKARGATVVMVTHKRGLLAQADKVMVMGDGAVHAFGGRDEVFGAMGRPRVVAGADAAAG